MVLPGTGTFDLTLMFERLSVGIDGENLPVISVKDAWGQIVQ